VCLSKSLELFQRDTELAGDFEEEGRSDFAASVNRNCHGATVRMIPALTTAGLAG